MLFTLAVGVAAINTGNNLFYLLVAMMLSLITMSGLLSELCLRRLEVGCHAPEFVYAETDVAVTLVLTNPKRRFPCFSLRLVEVISGRGGDKPMPVNYLPPGGTVLVSYPIRAARRGRLDIDGFQIATPFPFGLFIKRSFHAHPMSIVVLPKPRPLPAPVLAGVSSAGVACSSARKGPGADLHNLRLYQPGDDSRLIHWMSTARTSQLIVRETQTDQLPRVTIRLSRVAPVGMEASLERGVVLSASLIAYFYNQGYRIRICVGDQHEASGPGADDLARLLTPLALCARAWPESSDPEDDPDRVDEPWADRTVPEVVVLPWSSPVLLNRYAHADAVFDTSHDLERGGSS